LVLFVVFLGPCVYVVGLVLFNHFGYLFQYVCAGGAVQFDRAGLVEVVPARKDHEWVREQRLVAAGALLPASYDVVCRSNFLQVGGEQLGGGVALFDLDAEPLCPLLVVGHGGLYFLLQLLVYLGLHLLQHVFDAYVSDPACVHELQRLVDGLALGELDRDREQQPPLPQVVVRLERDLAGELVVVQLQRELHRALHQPVRTQQVHQRLLQVEKREAAQRVRKLKRLLLHRLPAVFAQQLLELLANAISSQHMNQQILHRILKPLVFSRTSK